jgi:ABC-type phosphate/phosphonate transport system substrate-binding protein
MASARFRFRSAAAWLVFALIAAGLARVARSESAENKKPVPFRLAFSSAMFTEINENDARASVKVWAQVIAKQRGIAADADAQIIRDPAAMIEAFRTGRADAAAMPLDEFAVVSQAVSFSHLFIAAIAEKDSEEYVVLVHRDSAIVRLAQLQGRELLVFNNPRSCLAEPWLDTQLQRTGAPAIAAFFGRIQHAAKLSKVVLSVFFRQADACLVSRRGFEVMSELNPQVGQQLRVIAASPPVVPMVLGIRTGYDPALLSQIVASVRELHTSPAGRQVLTVFQSERLEETPPARLATSLALLAEHTQLAAAEAARASKDAGQPTSAGGAN